LLIRLEPCDFERMGNRQLVLVERSLRFGNELIKRNPPLTYAATSQLEKRLAPRRDSFKAEGTLLVLPESFQWIEPHGAASRDPAGQKRNGQ
jgi:hypothetical protein